MVYVCILNSNAVFLYVVCGRMHFIPPTASVILSIMYFAYSLVNHIKIALHMCCCRRALLLCIQIQYLWRKVKWVTTHSWTHQTFLLSLSLSQWWIVNQIEVLLLPAITICTLHKRNKLILNLREVYGSLSVFQLSII